MHAECTRNAIATVKGGISAKLKDENDLEKI